jgi:uncharacterized protein (TIGR00303 family)
MITIHTQPELAANWLSLFQGRSPLFACVLGFTDTGLVPGISAAGATPEDRRFTAIADAEFLYSGPDPNPIYPLPPLTAGASPVFISRAVLTALNIPLELFNAGLPRPPAVPSVDLGGLSARCLSRGHALPSDTVTHLLAAGQHWGEKLAAQVSHGGGYLILAECVVGGTTTALGVLTGLGWQVAGKINSSHPTCNHPQKWPLVEAGLAAAELVPGKADPLQVVAALGDPMQVVVAGMAIAASRHCGILLAGGTQMLAVYALTRAIAHRHNLEWEPQQVIVGTTRWVANDQTGDTVGLAQMLDAPLVATDLSFAQSRYPQLRAFEKGFVKEGVGAGGCAIAAHLYRNWGQAELLAAIEQVIDDYARGSSGS